MRLANKVKMIDLVDNDENCISRGVADTAANIRYRCIKMKAKAQQAWCGTTRTRHHLTLNLYGKNTA